MPTLISDLCQCLVHGQLLTRSMTMIAVICCVVVPPMSSARDHNSNTNEESEHCIMQVLCCWLWWLWSLTWSWWPCTCVGDGKRRTGIVAHTYTWKLVLHINQSSWELIPGSLNLTASLCLLLLNAYLVYVFSPLPIYFYRPTHTFVCYLFSVLGVNCFLRSVLC